MFTGLIQAVGEVESVRPQEGRTELVINPAGWSHQPEHGESISVSGCCLTVAGIGSDGSLTFHAIPETLSRTTLGSWGRGRRVNLERSLRASDLMGGHVVQGHIDGVGAVERVVSQGEWRITIAAPGPLRQYLVPKGSIAIDGVSLTVAAIDVERGTFEVTLIPVTLELTTLGALRAGDTVNLEMDAMAKTIVHYLRHFADTGVPGTPLHSRP